MAEEQMRMDGNAAAGLLAEVFSFEMTTSLARCAGCGTSHLVGTLLVYGGPMGTIMRCPGCDTAMIRIALIRDEYLLDLRGTRTLRIPAGGASAA
jgi:hypothetical protein